MSAPQAHLADHILRDTSAPVRAVLEKSLEGRELESADAIVLLGATGRDLQVLCMVADMARHDDVGDEVSYVINRNINSTNVCYVGCSFCGFARHKGDEDAYDRDLADILARAREGWELGASEVCIHREHGADAAVGLPQELDGFEILSATTNVWYPLSLLARVIQVEHRGDSINSHSIEVVVSQHVKF